MSDHAETRYREERVAHWDRVARDFDPRKSWGKGYHRRMTEVYRFLVAPGLKVLELGCGQGDLLAALRPFKGVGVDFSGEMLSAARARHPELTFVEADAASVELEEPFDVIILSDLLNDLWDVQAVLEHIRRFATPRTRVILNLYSHLWELPLRLAEKVGLSRPKLYQNWLTVEDTEGLLNLARFEVVRTWPEFLWPFRTPLVASFFNRFLVRLWPFRWFALTHMFVARLQPRPPAEDDQPSVSVVVAARNEAGNIENIFARVPRMGRETEIVFVEGHSKDDTYEAIERARKQHPEWPCQLYRQPGEGKGDAVRLGFDKAKGDILMILDADLTVPPEDLPRFYEAVRARQGEFINGVRLVYPMEKEAMRFFNLLGNKFFSLAFSWLLGQPLRDSLCGTKVLFKRDYERIAANRNYFGDFDPFGDFDLIFGAAKQGMKIVDLPVRYRERVYGDTNIRRWSHGWLLLKMVCFAARRIKFV